MKANRNSSDRSSQRNFSLSIKNVDVYLIKSFIPPFVVTLFITLFILIMQFLWVYVDDLVGKGLSTFIILELLFFASASMVPLAMPLATLLSSMMTMGNLAEHYELTSFKSSGVSLWRIIRSLLITSIMLSVAALLFSNYVLPVANLKFGTLLYDIRKQRPALNIKPGVFYTELEGYSIRVGRKEADNQTLHDVMIYDHTRGRGNDYVITAESGKMYLTEDKRYLVLQLYTGNQFEELSPSPRPGKKYEQVRVSFKEWKKVFDLSDFALEHTDERLFKENYKMQNLRQLQYSIDTTNMEIATLSKNVNTFTRSYLSFSRTNLDSLSHKPIPDTLRNRATLDSATLVSKALSSARSVKSYMEYTSKSRQGKEEVLSRFKMEWQRKFSLSFACFVLFLIGASLGAIIRKGGFGLPFVVSVFFFVIFYILSIAGEKMGKEGALGPFSSMWFSTFILLPVSFYLLYKANRDSALLNTDAYISALQRILKKLPMFKD